MCNRGLDYIFLDQIADFCDYPISLVKEVEQSMWEMA